MSFFDTQNPGIGGLKELTSTELALVQSLASLGDPNANRILGWDDTDNNYSYFAIGTNLSYDHSTHTLSASGGASGLTIGTTTITSGTTTRVLFDNAGVLGEYTISGTGNVAMTTSPVFTTPNIGSATGSVSGNAGTATALQNARTIGGVSFDGTANITVASATGGFTVTGGALTVTDQNVVLSATTGTKFGTATTQKLSFYNSTPIVQPTGNIITALTNLGLVATPTLPASSVSSGAALTKTDDTNVTLTLGGTPTTALLVAASLTLGWTGTLSGTRGGTGVNNGASTITLGGSFTTSGAFTTTLTVTANTNVTLPTTGTLATLAGSEVLTNKTMTGATNTLTAKLLKSATTEVDVSAATAPSSGQVLTATSSTTATWQTPAGGTVGAGSLAVVMSTIFETGGRFNTSVAGGTATFNTVGLTLTTTTTANRFASATLDILSNGSNGVIWANNPVFSVGMQITITSGTSAAAFFGIGQMSVAAGATGLGTGFTENHIGFKLVNSGGTLSLFGTQANNVTETATSALTTVAANDYLDLVCKVNGTSSVDYYWRQNNGAWSSTTNLTTNIPTGTPASSTGKGLQWTATNFASASAITAVIGGCSFSR